MPKSLFGRSLIIVVAPMVLLQSVLTFVFLERHWQLVTQRMSEAVAREMATLVEVLESYPQDAENETFNRIASNSLGMRVDVLPLGTLPSPAPKPFFNLLDRTLAREISTAVRKPFWIDTVGDSNLIEVRFLLQDKILRIITRRSQAYATNSHIFLVWMVGTSLVLILISVAFLRNQIRPIQRLAKAADRFGRGQSISNIPHAGAKEVRKASHALVEMSERIERQIDQRAIMLAGVSHDLRTILTRFRLQLAMLEASDDKVALIQDVDDMEQMLHDYMAFANGTAQEAAQPVDLRKILQSFCEHADLQNVPCTFTIEGNSAIEVRPNAFKRCVGNMFSNACRYGKHVKITAKHGVKELSISVEDDGPGIPESAREDVFKPFFRLDEARNQDQSGTGLGLAIARDIALVHGGDIKLGTSELGGLKADLIIPTSNA
ncbi:MAG: ATP-binding protein [Hyphomicrobiales bacterium]